MLKPRPYRQLKISAIIPAFNETKYIRQVLRPLMQVATIKEIILVDDGSTDGTAELAKSYGGVDVIRLPLNMGKTQAVMRGLRQARHPTILLCDADLIGLRASHFFELIHRYCEGYEMFIMENGSQSWIFRKVLKSVPAVSGTRILAKERLLEIPFKPTDRFQFEIRINDYYLAQNLSMAVSPAWQRASSRPLSELGAKVWPPSWLIVCHHFPGRPADTRWFMYTAPSLRSAIEHSPSLGSVRPPGVHVKPPSSL